MRRVWTSPVTHEKVFEVWLILVECLYVLLLYEKLCGMKFHFVVWSQSMCPDWYFSHSHMRNITFMPDTFWHAGFVGPTLLVSCHWCTHWSTWALGFGGKSMNKPTQSSTACSEIPGNCCFICTYGENLFNGWRGCEQIMELKKTDLPGKLNMLLFRNKPVDEWKCEEWLKIFQGAWLTCY